MNSIHLAKKSFSNSLDRSLIFSILIPYLILIGVGPFIILFPTILLFLTMGSNNIFFIFLILFVTFILLFGQLTFFPILIEALRINTQKSTFVLPKAKLILTKARKIFIAEIFPFLLTFIGTFFFVIPGIIFAKRYLYVSLIVEEEMIGPIAAMRKSRELSRKNGWSILLAFILCFIIYIFLYIAISFINQFLPFPLSFLIDTLFAMNIIITYNSITFFGYLNAQKSS